MPNREAEWRLLRMAYDVAQFAGVTEYERPDFLVRPREGQQFGAEVTELFQTESHARIHVREDYLPSLWSGGARLHKDDYRELNVVRVNITDGEGNVKAADVPAVLTNPIPQEEYRKRIADRITAKTARSYSTDELSHLDLVIYDDIRTFKRGEFDVTDCLRDGVREALLASPFREVLWISSSSSGHVVRSLRLLLFVEQASLFGHALDHVASDRLAQPGGCLFVCSTSSPAVAASRWSTS